MWSSSTSPTCTKKIDAGREPMIHTMRAVPATSSSRPPGVTVRVFRRVLTLAGPHDRRAGAGGVGAARGGHRAGDELLPASTSWTGRCRTTSTALSRLSRGTSRSARAPVGTVIAGIPDSGDLSSASSSPPVTTTATTDEDAATLDAWRRRPGRRRVTVEDPPSSAHRVAAAPSPAAPPCRPPRAPGDRDGRQAGLVEALFAAIAVAVAAGAALVVVRRQLRPLREVATTAHTVAALPMESGAIDIEERVPDRLTDERTEAGRVGAALNTLLAHVEESLSERHRSEQQVRQFVADASHELRSPLATIAGYTELARRRQATPRRSGPRWTRSRRSPAG